MKLTGAENEKESNYIGFADYDCTCSVNILSTQEQGVLGYISGNKYLEEHPEKLHLSAAGLFNTAIIEKVL